jgi:chromosome partitioning protein
MPAMHYDKSSVGAKSYLALAGEILRRAEHALSNPQPVEQTA